MTVWDSLRILGNQQHIHITRKHRLCLVSGIVCDTALDRLSDHVDFSFFFYLQTIFQTETNPGCLCGYHLPFHPSMPHTQILEKNWEKTAAGHVEQ